MSRDGKFGTFAGVFTPSLLTILGVIMYLRLPWVIGNAGLFHGLGIILVAHVISVSTGLSISSIATDRAVGAGGPYYIISRSLGLPIGGALGLSLCIGLAFSISLYLIGFSQSFLAYFELGSSLTNIRICGSIAITALTIVTFISTALALKTQYLIMAMIGLSLLSIALGGGSGAQASPYLLGPAPDAPALASLFAIFFPAVTGFTAGVNMSGDLRSPKRAIPRGTMAAIAAGFVVYCGLALFLGMRVSRDQLVADPDVLLHVAANGPLVVAGIWAATLSSGLGSILGSPRVLQAVAADGIVPKFFARGYGPTHEPRNALVLSFLIGEAGILIGELDVIARIVSMIFLSMYCVLNLSCALESWASPDFRPDFRIPKSISIAGAITSLIVMIQLDLAAMLGALLLMAALFFYLERKQLRLESGDTWEGFWATLVRAGLHRLTLDARQERLWKPNVLAFDSAAKPSDERWNRARHKLAEALAGRTGIVTHVSVSSGASGASMSLRAGTRGQHSLPRRSDAPQPRTAAGVFHRQLFAADDDVAAIAEFCRHYGFAGVEPNTVLLQWSDYSDEPLRLARLLRELAEQDYNQLVLAQGGRAERERKQRIDIYWHDQGGNLPLTLSLARFITASSGFEAAALRFVLLSEDVSNSDVLRAKARRYLGRMRVDAEIKVISNALSIKAHEQWVSQESADADLVMWPMPDAASDADAYLLQRAAELLGGLPDVIFVRACSSFEEVLSPGKAASRSLLPKAAERDSALELAALALPAPPALSDYVGQLKLGFERALAGLDEHCLAAVHSRNIELVRRMRSALERQLDTLHKGLSGANAQRRRNLLNRFASAFVIDVQGIIDEHLQAGVPDQQASLEGRIVAFQDEQARLLSAPREGLLAVREPAELAPLAGDSPAVLRIKRRLRWAAWLRRRPPQYRVALAPLERYYFERAQRELLAAVIGQLLTESYQLAVQLGKLVCSSRAGITTIIARAMEENAADDALLAVLKPRALEPFDQLVARTKARVGRRREQLSQAAHALLQQFADDLDRLDVGRLTARERKLPRDAAARHAALAELPQGFAALAAGLFQRAHIGLLVSGFHQRLAAIVERQKQAAALALRNGALRVCEELLGSLNQLSEALEREPLDALKPIKLLTLDERLDPKALLSELLQEAGPALRDLPESVALLADAVIDQLEEGQSPEAPDAPSVAVPLRALAQFLVEGELTAGIAAQMEAAPGAEARAISVAREVTRLITFQLGELSSLGSDEPKARARHMQAALVSSRERLQAEIDQLRALGERIGERFDLQLAKLVERSDPYSLTEAGSQLALHRRTRQGKSAVSGAHGLMRRAQVSLRAAAVSLLYQSSASLLRLRARAREQTEGSLVERLRAWVSQHSPQPQVLSAMPFYYRQVFLGQAQNESFWVGRDRELARARRAIQAHRDGQSGVIWVTGRPGTGKSVLCQRIAHKACDAKRVRWVAPPASAAADLAGFRAAIAQAHVSQAELDEKLAALPEQSTLVIDDLELWWERCEGGLRVIDELLRLVRAHGKRVLFLIGVDHHVFALLNRVRPLGDQTLASIECGPMAAQELGVVLSLRHGSTGLKLELHGRAEDTLSSLQLARLFAHHFRYADGCVGSALRGWVAHIDKVREQVICLRAPQRPRTELLGELRSSWRALLLELALHRRLTTARLAHIALQPAQDVERELETLMRAGLVTKNRQGACELEPFVRQLLLSHFETRGLLPA